MQDVTKITVGFSLTLVLATALNSLFGAGTTRFYCYGSVNDGDKENFAVDINFATKAASLGKYGSASIISIRAIRSTMFFDRSYKSSDADFGAIDLSSGRTAVVLERGGQLIYGTCYQKQFLF
jgi:hypothetical protein